MFVRAGRVSEAADYSALVALEPVQEYLGDLIR